ncbi:relaxase/mobilization nuclease domain-containing protein [Haloarcula nitratireducens]|uniref:Relaxase/mobilization nuclease domain-containing protein n=1 Tax=Haloarcula nitratireducens TaxID=2487749 RepID=A0AAW4PGI4_9EURY|nr:relaxase/mobilization nuclease domain-containing protein [Halomicroarcula nitratireducens]MBX0296857.1 relaxase/mobilization nuclease domain-containing protein [Halomicroarcula nitratireducens]
MILKTDFQRSGAGKLLKYIRRDRETDQEKVPLRDRLGREADKQRIEQFLERSSWFNFQRHLIVSPDPSAEFTPDEVSSNTRELLENEFGGQPTTDYVYAVHDDSDIVHSHVAATGNESELRMDAEELERLRGRAKEVFREPERLKGRTPERDSAPLPDDATRDQAQTHKAAESTTPDPDRDPETTRERDFDFGGGR